MKKINYSSFQTPHYFDQLLILFLIICFIFTLIIIDNSKGLNVNYLLTYILIFFLIITIAVLIEYKNKSEYISPMENIHIRHFFNNFNHSQNKDEFIHKYNAKTLKQLNKNIKNHLKYELTNIIKKNKFYELHIAEKPSGDKLYILKFLFKKNNHKLTIHTEDNNLKIIRIS